LAFQYINNDRTVALSVLEETLNFIKSQMGAPTGQANIPNRYVWDSMDGSVILAERGVMDFWSINFLVTGKQGKGVFK
jgi:hypothetical protein